MSVIHTAFTKFYAFNFIAIHRSTQSRAVAIWPPHSLAVADRHGRITFKLTATSVFFFNGEEFLGKKPSP